MTDFLFFCPIFFFGNKKWHIKFAAKKVCHFMQGKKLVQRRKLHHDKHITVLSSTYFLEWNTAYAPSTHILFHEQNNTSNPQHGKILCKTGRSTRILSACTVTKKLANNHISPPTRKIQMGPDGPESIIRRMVLQVRHHSRRINMGQIACRRYHYLGRDRGRTN